MAQNAIERAKNDTSDMQNTQAGLKKCQMSAMTANTNSVPEIFRKRVEMAVVSLFDFWPLAR